MRVSKNFAFVAAVAVVLIMFCVGQSIASPSYTTLTLPELNADIRTWTFGSDYNSLFPSTQTWNGIPFSLAETGDEYHYTVFNGASLKIPVNVYGVTDVYTIINSSWGVDSIPIGKVEFFGDDGAYDTIDLIEGTNVRDHYNGSYNNSIDNVSAISAFTGVGGARLDTQLYILPANFLDENLDYMLFTSYLLGDPDGSPFIAAATVSAETTPPPPSVPEPATMLLFGSGLIGLVGFRRKKLFKE